jgi:hypothetical protein
VVEVDLPMDSLERFQTRAGELWPEGVVYRVRTTHGDDFLVDADASRVVLENDLGSFAPYLSECASLAPVADPSGDWRIELTNGTVLIGPLADSSIGFVLPHGPETITVPLEVFVSMERQEWAEPAALSWTSASAPVAEQPQAAEPPSPAPRRALSDTWFENDRYEEYKAAH